MAWPGGKGSGRSIRVPGRPQPRLPSAAGPPGGETRRASQPPAAPCGSPPPQPPPAPVAARGQPGPREGRDDPCWPEQRKLASAAPPSRSAPSTPGLGGSTPSLWEPWKNSPSLRRCRAAKRPPSAGYAASPQPRSALPLGFSPPAAEAPKACAASRSLAPETRNWSQMRPNL